MKNVFFKPWVGKDYFNNGGIFKKKILVLGESHRCKDPQECPECGDFSILHEGCRNFTTKTVEAFLDYHKGVLGFSRWMNTYTKFSKVIINKTELNLKHLNSIWDSVVFYNYVQSSMGEARVAPSAEQFENSKKAFYEILEEYKPDIIIVWGQRLWNSMPSGGEFGEDIMINNKNKGKLYYYILSNEKKVLAYFVNHPSTRWFNYEWYPYLSKLIE